MKPTTEEIMAAYSEKLASDIASMSDEEVQAHLADMESGEQLAKVATENEALGRFMQVGWKAGVEDFAELLTKHAGDKAAAIAEYEDDLVKMAGEIEVAEEAIGGLEAGEETGEETPEDVALAAALEADPDAMKTAALQVLADRNIGIFSVDDAGNAVEELQLA